MHTQFPLTGYVGLILRSNAVATASWSTVLGTMRVFWGCCERSYSAHSSCRQCKVPSMVFQLSAATAVLGLETQEAGQDESGRVSKADQWLKYRLIWLHHYGGVPEVKLLFPKIGGTHSFIC